MLAIGRFGSKKWNADQQAVRTGSENTRRHSAGDSMKLISLQSGSNGNCIYVEAGDVRLLFDAGISGIQAQQRLAEHGRDISRIDGLLISHDSKGDRLTRLGVRGVRFH